MVRGGRGRGARGRGQPDGDRPGGPELHRRHRARAPASDPCGPQLYLIVGADVAAELDTWHGSTSCATPVTLVIVDRGGVGSGEDPAGWRVERLRIPALDISSSELRQRLAEGRSVDFLIPEPAILCIRRLDLYAGTR